MWLWTSNPCALSGAPAIHEGGAFLLRCLISSTSIVIGSRTGGSAGWSMIAASLPGEALHTWRRRRALGKRRMSSPREASTPADVGPVRSGAVGHGDGRAPRCRWEHRPRARRTHPARLDYAGTARAACLGGVQPADLRWSKVPASPDDETLPVSPARDRRNPRKHTTWSIASWRATCSSLMLPIFRGVSSIRSHQ